MSGNTGLLKHASNVPQCALAIQDIFEQAGFPQGAFNTLLIDSDQVETRDLEPIHQSSFSNRVGTGWVIRGGLSW